MDIVTGSISLFLRSCYPVVVGLFACLFFSSSAVTHTRAQTHAHKPMYTHIVTHTLTHKDTRAHIQIHTHTLADMLTHGRAHPHANACTPACHPPPSHTHTLSLSLTHSLTHSPTHAPHSTRGTYCCTTLPCRLPHPPPPLRFTAVSKRLERMLAVMSICILQCLH